MYCNYCGTPVDLESADQKQRLSFNLQEEEFTNDVPERFVCTLSCSSCGFHVEREYNYTDDLLDPENIYDTEIQELYS